MDKMPVKSKRHNREAIIILTVTSIILVIYAVWQCRFIQDLWRSTFYNEPANVSAIRSDLALTQQGQRIFLATQPAIESAEDFNEHCNSHKTEVSLLGCYTNDRIYIYEITLDSLKDSNKVTAAHELLHAIWARLSTGERERVEQLLAEVKRVDPDWVEEELSLYEESEKIEELYTRVGTKLRDIPENLELHYQAYFTDRLKIVDFYESYQTPFEELQQRNSELKLKVEKLGIEIEQERREYDQGMEALKQDVDSFNTCAETEGCFRSEAEFRRRRSELEQRENMLESLRLNLNEKIEANNQAIDEYQANAKSLGELSDALNSNIKTID